SAPVTATNSADGQLASILITLNQGEIALGKLAEQRAKDKEVKQFAEMMVKDHTDFLQKLEKFAGNSANRMETRSDIRSGTSAQAGGVQPGIERTGAQEMAGHQLDFVALHQQIGEKCLEMTKKDLEQKEGDEFDKCYIGAQIGMHTGVLATLEVFR